LKENIFNKKIIMKRQIIRWLIFLKKFSLKRTLVILFLTVLLNSTNAQWRQTSMPGGASVWELAITNDTNFFVGTLVGCFRSSDKGTSWMPVNTDEPLLNQRCYTFSDGLNLFVSTKGSTGKRFLRSSDNGTSWISADLGLTGTNYVQSLTSLGSNIFISKGQEGIFHSTDNGLSWTSVKINLPNSTSIAWVKAIGANLFACSSEDANGFNRLFLYYNGVSYNGGNWIKVSLPDTLVVRCIAVNGSNIFVGGAASNEFHRTKGKGIYRSTNNGANWTAVNSGLTNFSELYFYGLEVMNGIIFATTLNGTVFRSINNGDSWVMVNEGIVEGIVMTFFKAIGNNLYAGGWTSMYRGGIFKSTDKGTTWAQIDSGLAGYNINALVSSNSKLLAGTDIGAFLSTDDGTNWIKINSGLPTDRPISSLAIVGTKIFTGFKNYYDGGTDDDLENGGIFLFNDEDKTWSKVLPGKLGNNTLSINSLTPYKSNIFAGTNLGVLRSTDYGANWIELMDSTAGPHIFSSTVMGTDIFAGSGDGLLRSTDNGTSWTNVNTGLPEISHSGWGSFVISLAVQGNILLAGTGNDMGKGDGIFLSTDRGTTWTAVNSGLPLNPYIRSIQSIGTYIYAATRYDGIYYSIDTCKNWLPVDFKLPVNTLLTSMMVDLLEKDKYIISENKALPSEKVDGCLFAGTFNKGIWRLNLENILLSTNDIIFKNKQPIVQISQQPGTISISYDLAAPCYVQATLYTVSGICTKVIVNRMETTGQHTFNIASNKFPSGVYIVKFQAGHNQDNKKFVLLK
jgi:photosystem II stability/assembly factor-like uncharacterized protein